MYPGYAGCLNFIDRLFSIISVIEKINEESDLWLDEVMLVREQLCHTLKFGYVPVK